MALGALVISTVIGILRFLAVGDRIGRERLNSTVDLSIAQKSLTRAMQTLVASRPIEPEPEPIDPGDDPQEDGLPPAEADPQTELIEQAIAGAGIDPAALGDDDALTQVLSLELSDTEPMMFELYLAESEEGVGIPTLELVTLEPVARAKPNPEADALFTQAYADYLGLSEEEAAAAMLDAQFASTFRAAFELVEYDDGWAFQYTPLVPPARPVVLVPDVTLFEIYALPRAGQGNDEGWVELFAAQTQIQFPIAVRVVIWTADGQKVDWVFETAIMTEGVS